MESKATAMRCSGANATGGLEAREAAEAPLVAIAPDDSTKVVPEVAPVEKPPSTDPDEAAMGGPKVAIGNDRQLRQGRREAISREGHHHIGLVRGDRDVYGKDRRTAEGSHEKRRRCGLDACGVVHHRAATPNGSARPEAIAAHSLRG